MASDSRPLSTLASLRPGLKALKSKAAVEKLKIPPPTPNLISSVESLATLIKKHDPETEWLQSKEDRNIFLQHARDAVMKVLEKTVDGLYSTTWARAGTIKQSQMLAYFVKLQPKLEIFADHWAAELFLSKCIRNKNVKRKQGGRKVSERKARLDYLTRMMMDGERENKIFQVSSW
jgi:hypothetical protein